MGKDYYETLGVEKGATKQEIKKAYKKLAKKYHPDISKEAGASDKFKEINEAAAVLGDEAKKANYDRYGTSDNQGSQGFEGFNSGGFDFEDLFGSIFGGGRRQARQSRATRGSDLRFDLDITLEEAAAGVSKSIIIPRLEQCDHCKGTGAENEDDVKTCNVCNGQGMVRMQQRTPFGVFQTTGPCKTCYGQGKVVKEFCHKCDGEGRINKNRKLEIKIPSGVETGSRLRVMGEGEAGAHGGPHGNLYVMIDVQAHNIFERDGNDLYVDVPLTFTQAALGTNIEVPTLVGKAKLKIPAGTQTHTVFRMKGKGIPDINGYSTGNQKVRVIVQVPEKLTKKQKELMSDLDKELKKPKKSFLQRIFE